MKANARRNAAGGLGRAWRWRPARAAAWALLERHVAPGSAVAVIGAGNGHDLPLARLGRRAGRLDLIDLDARALKGTRRRLRLAGVRAQTLVEDITAGRAEAIVRHAVTGRPLEPGPRVHGTPVGRPPYDAVIVDLMLSQLLYPALSDAGLSRRATDSVLLAHGQGLTNTLVGRLAASAPGGLIILRRGPPRLVAGPPAAGHAGGDPGGARSRGGAPSGAARTDAVRLRRPPRAAGGGCRGHRPRALAVALLRGNRLPRLRDRGAHGMMARWD